MVVNKDYEAYGVVTETQGHGSDSEKHAGIEAVDAAYTSQGLQRKLKARHVQMIAIGSCIGTGLFIGSGKSLHAGGPLALVMGFILISVALTSMVQCLGEISVVIPVSGAFTRYATRFFDKSLGFAIGWQYWCVPFFFFSSGRLNRERERVAKTNTKRKRLAWVAVFGAEASAFVILINYWDDNPDLTPLWISIFIVINLAIHLCPVRIFGEVEFVVSAIKVVAVVVFIIVTWAIMGGAGSNGRKHGAEYWHLPGLENGLHNGFWGMAAVFVNAAFASGGVEMVGVVAGEAQQPRWNLPRGIRTMIWRIVIFYVVSMIFLSFVVPYNDDNLIGGSNAKSSPFVVAIFNAGIAGLPDLLNAVVMVCVCSVGSTSIYISSRTLHAMAEDGFAFEIFTRTDKQGRPYAALLFTGAVGIVLAYLNCSATGALVFSWFSAISGMAFFLAWLTIIACNWRFHAALKAQGDTTLEQPYAFRASLWPWYSILGFVSILFMVICQFIVSVWPEDPRIPGAKKPSAENFFQNFLSVPIFLGMWAGYKLLYWKDCKWLPASQIDIITGRREEDPDEMTKLKRYHELSFGQRALTYTLIGEECSSIRVGLTAMWLGLGGGKPGGTAGDAAKRHGALSFALSQSFLPHLSKDVSTKENLDSPPMAVRVRGFFDNAVTFGALYLTSLFSLTEDTSWIPSRRPRARLSAQQVGLKYAAARDPRALPAPAEAHGAVDQTLVGAVAEDLVALMTFVPRCQAQCRDALVEAAAERQWSKLRLEAMISRVAPPPLSRHQSEVSLIRVRHHHHDSKDKEHEGRDDTEDDAPQEYKRLINGKLIPPSNVTRITRAIKSQSADGIQQIVYYQAGVGSTGTLTNKIIGGATGAGLADNVREAYSFLANNYNEGDEIFLVGFSRGAFTARSVGGLIGNIGLLTKAGLPYFPIIYKDWAHRNTRSYRSPQPDLPFRNKPSMRDPMYVKRLEEKRLTTLGVRIRAIAVWDTVGSLGVPRVSWLGRFGKRTLEDQNEYAFYDTTLDDCVDNAFQALALDERRAPFQPAVWEKTRSNQRTNLIQVWFPGVHANCGGGYDDQELSNITLAWMLAMLTPLLEIDQNFIMIEERANEDYYNSTRQEVRPWSFGKIYDSVTGAFAVSGESTRTPGQYVRMDPRNGNPTNRPLKNTCEYIHSSVRSRTVMEGPGYDDRGNYDSKALRDWRLRSEKEVEGLPTPWYWEERSPRGGAPIILPEAPLRTVEKKLLRISPDIEEFVLSAPKPPKASRRRRTGGLLVSLGSSPKVLFSRCISLHHFSSSLPESTIRASPLMVALILDMALVFMLSSMLARLERAAAGGGEPSRVGSTVLVGGRVGGHDDGGAGAIRGCREIGIYGGVSGESLVKAGGLTKRAFLRHCTTSCGSVDEKESLSKMAHLFTRRVASHSFRTSSSLFSTSARLSRTPALADVTTGNTEAFDRKSEDFRKQLTEHKAKADSQSPSSPSVAPTGSDDQPSLISQRSRELAESAAAAARNALSSSADAEPAQALGSLSTATGDAKEADTHKDAKPAATPGQGKPKSRQSALASIIYGTEEGRQMDREIERSFSQVLARGKYVHSIVFHEVKPSKVDEYTELVGGWYPKVAADPANKVNLVGSWRTEVGDCDTFVHIWEYQAYPGYHASLANIQHNEEFRSFDHKLKKLIHSKRTSLMQEFSFWPTTPPRKLGGIFELRSYTLHPGNLLEWETHWRKGLAARKEVMEGVGAWFVQVGELNTVHHLWQFADLEERKRRREMSWAVPGWGDTVHKTVPLIQSMKSRVLVPCDWSPVA
ncbi:hypothetical protein FH972_024244 [Carpinus fangiana]|uniref:DUF2235 domain-containing protein n=1 Tax=Carpinus fangiana TaxID=176857 RepID=A0A5N6KY00_9ROSI|nr:hypothetical protein FH972_024244 [Carpinus fangiana]